MSLFLTRRQMAALLAAAPIPALPLNLALLKGASVMGVFDCEKGPIGPE